MSQNRACRVRREQWDVSCESMINLSDVVRVWVKFENDVVSCLDRCGVVVSYGPKRTAIDWSDIGMEADTIERSALKMMGTSSPKNY